MGDRAERATMRVRVMRQTDDVEGADTLAMAPAQRLAMIWPLAQSASRQPPPTSAQTARKRKQ